MTNREILNLEKDIKDLSIEEMILKIREYNQMDLYTVDKDWCLQLFSPEICANDECSCDWESSSKDLKLVLISALEYIAECVEESWM